MELDKGRAKPTDVTIEETLETRLAHLAEIKTELKKLNDEHNENTKNLREIKKSLENIIIDEVKKRKQTVTVGDIRAEYVPQVIIKMKKVRNG